MLDLFADKKPIFAKLEAFGFVAQNKRYVYKTDILDGAFELSVMVDMQGLTTTRLTDKDTDEEYRLHLIEAASGKFVGQVREACREVLRQIAEGCFEFEIFKSRQAKALLAYVKEKHGDEAEYLWEKFPDNAVWRRQDNQKWYGAILTVKAEKLGLGGAEKLEVLDIRADSDEIDRLVDDQRYFRGYHMNKKTWLTIPLNNSVSLTEICERLDQSYVLAGK